MSKLFDAVKDGNLEQLQTLIEAGADITEKDNDGRNALHYAALYNRHKLISYLFSLSKNLHIHDKCDETPATYAVEYDHPKVLRALDAEGVVLDGVDSCGSSLLHEAIDNGRLLAAKQLLICGVDVNLQVDGITPLHSAISTKNIELVKLLLEHGADVNQAGYDNIAPLYYAASINQLDIVKLLLSRGAHIDRAVTDGATALGIAALNGYVDIVKELILQGGAS